MFINIQIDLLMLKTYNGQFTLTTKKSLHIIFKVSLHTFLPGHSWLHGTTVERRSLWQSFPVLRSTCS